MNGSEYWEGPYNEYNGTARYYINYSQNQIQDEGKSNYFLLGVYANRMNDGKPYLYVSNSTIQIRTNITSLADFKTWLSTHNTTIILKISTPVTTPITDQTLLAQFETLINMKTYKDITNIELTGEDLAPVLDCDYYQDMSTVKSDITSIKARLDLLED